MVVMATRARRAMEPKGRVWYRKRREDERRKDKGGANLDEHCRNEETEQIR